MNDFLSKAKEKAAAAAKNIDVANIEAKVVGKMNQIAEKIETASEQALAKARGGKEAPATPIPSTPTVPTRLVEEAVQSSRRGEERAARVTCKDAAPETLFTLLCGAA